MKLSEFKTILNNLQSVDFQFENGEKVPNHFHVTEIGAITKRFIDCGGVLRNDQVINFQLWTALDYDHRLAPENLNNIIKLSEEKLGLIDAEIEVEYQTETIGKYGLNFKDNTFILTNTMTDCLAKDACGIPEDKRKVKLSDIKTNSSACCTPGGGCC